MSDDQTTPLGSALDLLTPLLDCTSESAGWDLCVQIACEVIGADFGVAIEFTGHDRAVLRAAVGFEDAAVGSAIPAPPDAQAGSVRGAAPVLLSNDLPNETAFVPSPYLLRAGVHSSMSIATELSDGGNALFGVHARRRHRFSPSDVTTFTSLVAVLSAAMGSVRRRSDLTASARTDALTRVANRTSILEHIEARLSSSIATTLLVIDLDGFRSINDTLGHAAGDAAIQQVAERIERCLGSIGRLGRLAGDEFVAVVGDGHNAIGLAEQMVASIEPPISVSNSQEVRLAVSLGVAQSRTDDDAMALLTRADRMMHEAKAAGGGRVHSDAPSTPDASSEQPGDRDGTAAGPASDLDDATPELVDSAIRGLRLVVQPIVDLLNTQVSGVEALTRGPLGHPLEMPDKLFAAATRFERLDDLELAAKQLAFDLPLQHGVDLYINVEPVLMCSDSWMARLRSAWSERRGHPTVTVELTEREVLRSPGQLLGAVDACRTLGWKIALDDVGSQSESLAALRWIAPDVIKLDMSLIDPENSVHAASIAAAVAAHRASGHHGGVRVIAEGVETFGHASVADVIGADLLQGYLLGRPAPIEQLDLDVAGRWDSGLVPPQRIGGKRVAMARDLEITSAHIEASALSSDVTLIACIPHADHFTLDRRRQYERLARRCGFVGVIGIDLSELPSHQLDGVRTADIGPDDPLFTTWQIVAVSPSITIGMVAHQIGTDEWGERQYSFRVITDAADAERTARSLLRYF